MSNSNKILYENLKQYAIWYVNKYFTTSENLKNILRKRLVKITGSNDSQNESTAKIISEILEKMKDQNLINDQNYANIKARSWNRRGKSVRMILTNLRKKKIDNTYIKKALSDLENTLKNPDRHASFAFAKRRRIGPIRNNNHQSSKENLSKMKKKDMFALSQAGFGYDICKWIIEAENDIEKLQSTIEDDL